MSLLKDVAYIKEALEEIKKSLIGEEAPIEKQYKEYKFFADARGMKLLSEKGLVDEYNEYMSQLEDILFDEIETYSAKEIVLPKPSKKLEAFKNKFNKFF